MDEHYVYDIANYGSGVAPFYTVLAIWVGMTILVSILKVHVDKKDFPHAKPYEYYFGRYLLFLLLSEIQAMVIVIGDLYIFGVQCKYPAELFLVAAVTSLTFSLLIYSLTISFGDIGKALAVVVMVIQIAGSGGTYPIEALPAFFRNVYIFFPFPYAINAMRECIGHVPSGSGAGSAKAFNLLRGIAGYRPLDPHSVYGTESLYRKAYGRHEDDVIWKQKKIN